MGDARSIELLACEHYYDIVCPPLGIIELMVKRIEEAQVEAVIVVPNWEAKAWHVWLREMASAVIILPWRSWPATWLDVSEAKLKPHELAQRFEFAAFAVDMRRNSLAKKGVAAMGRWKDQQIRLAPRTRLQKSVGKRQKNPRHVVLRRLLNVLSACGGMGTVGWCFKRVIKLLGLSVEVQVKEIELCREARAVAEVLGEGVTQQLTPHNLWQWVTSDEDCRRRAEELGLLDWSVAGFCCQDMSVANRGGKGLAGEKSSILFALLKLFETLRSLHPGMDVTYECTNFSKRFPQQWAYVNAVTGTNGITLEAGTVARCWRRRAFWNTFEVLPLEPRKLTAASVLEPNRQLLHRWKDKLPTITTHPGSWNMARVVTDNQGRVGPLTVKEIASALQHRPIFWKYVLPLLVVFVRRIASHLLSLCHLFDRLVDLLRKGGCCFADFSDLEAHRIH